MASFADCKPAFTGPAPLAISASTPSCAKCPRRGTAVKMLRVQKGRRPENWDNMKSKLSGRFLPLDPRDEDILDLLVGDNSLFVSLEDAYATDRPGSESYDETAAESPKWSRRSEAARKRWADPAYRAKVLEKRTEKKRRNAELNGTKAKVEIGPVDSITRCKDDKAKIINDYARSNKLRSEKITAFHRNPKGWMENRLRDSPMRLSDEEYVNKKIEMKDRRRRFALEREERLRKEKKPQNADEEED